MTGWMVLLIAFSGLQLIGLCILFLRQTQFNARLPIIQFDDLFHQQQLHQQTQLHELQQKLTLELTTFRENFDQHQFKNLQLFQQHFQAQVTDMRQQLTDHLNQHHQLIETRLNALSETTAQQLGQINQQVDKRLSEGFEKTTATFTDVVKRLAIIDAAQQKISELSHEVISLNDVLNDKRSRGAFGEVQLEHLVQNMLPPNGFVMQHTLSNQTRVDCLLRMPDHGGDIAVDAKFPLENFQRLCTSTTLAEQNLAKKQFAQDVRKHIQNIAEKYIIPHETAEGAMMFLPAEAIFAEIHARHPQLVDFAHQSRVWLVSPTTMMAVLTTAKAVLKDKATRQQVHIIQQHLTALHEDFNRFQSRMEKLSRHIEQAHQDVEQVHISSKKITSRFQKIEQVELEHLTGLEHD